MATNNEKRCYTVKELQEILDVSRPTVYELLKRKEFHSVIVGGKHLISKKSFDAWLNGFSEESMPYNSSGKREEEDIGFTRVSQMAEKTNVPFDPCFEMTNVDSAQEISEYHKNQERILQNLFKAYLMIDSK